MTQIKMLTKALVEFYEKIYSWEACLVREKGFTLPQVHTIEILGIYGEMQMKELSKKLGITTGTLTTQVNKLVNAGYVTRKAHDLDRRSILVSLTPLGIEIYNEHQKLHIELVEKASDKLTLAERSHFLICLKKINQGLDDAEFDEKSA